ncbi:DUF190 domain-containing protein [Streptomyces sp. NPDC047017]|uniref:DUF190 domain-containing protein n=1 Tax=Streptomyces sp. NPDC047017 TaxID=3155024 RepID=UPI0033E70D83
MTPHEITAVRLTVHLSSGAMWHHRPAYAEIVHRAHRQGLAGATVLHGFEGYGTHLKIHHDRPARLRSHSPCAVVVVDGEAAVRAFVDSLADILSVNGVAVLDRVRVHPLPGRSGGG